MSSLLQAAPALPQVLAAATIWLVLLVVDRDLDLAVVVDGRGAVGGGRVAVGAHRGGGVMLLMPAPGDLRDLRRPVVQDAVDRGIAVEAARGRLVQLPSTGRAGPG